MIGMTLAEVFLLLLIVGWYGSRLESEQPDGGPPALATVLKTEFDDAERLRKEAESNLAQKNREYEQLSRILDWIAKTSGLAKPIRNLDEARAAIDNIKVAAKRGRPPCGADNVLLNVSADSGVTVATVRQDQIFRGHRYSAGQRLVGKDLESFFSDVEAFYQGRRVPLGGGDCVYDFALVWRTDADYRAARELFERHLYPAGIRSIK